MKLKRAFLWTWLGGLAIFAVVVAMGLPLSITEVPGGIIDHQAAGTAAEIDRIHFAWLEAGVYDQARNSMFADLVFIGVFGVGCMLGGLWFMQSPVQRVRLLGVSALLAGLLFLVTDYAETISQVIQVLRIKGDDTLAGIAATVRPTKMAAFVIGFIAVLIALVLDRKSQRDG